MQLQSTWSTSCAATVLPFSPSFIICSRREPRNEKTATDVSTNVIVATYRANKILFLEQC